MDTSAVATLQELPAMSARLHAAPKVVRLEALPLACGESAVVVELDSVPGRGWAKALKRVLADTEGLESTQLRCDGRFAYFIGVELDERGTAHRINQALAAASERTGPGTPTTTPAAAMPAAALAAPQA
ncbi:hypothetical protein [Stenotrophomonas sp. ZAC14D2_NAIMI4_7]|uniref:hypothetical protein n=1 Tax=Stenotrophomonas sp. ZAC14D2_NAIMI4_7 TaxID=2072405 RepID=UPI00131EF377|nr:hypothetical protein [Stenotrophomonas sp. ZAC14D2_NAIMI4_7]